MLKESVMNQVTNKLDELWDEEVKFLQKICSFESTLGNEQPVQQFIAKNFKEMGLQVEEVYVDVEKLQDKPGFSKPEWGEYENRPNIVGILKGANATTGKSLIMQGHVDVVSAEPKKLWKTDPFGSVLKEGRMYGRGTGDMKAGIAAMIYAVKAIQTSNIKLGNDIILQTVIEEECTGNGALAVLDAGYIADAALICEPTDHEIMNAQVGVFWVRVVTEGFGTHAERANLAVNPIHKVPFILQAFEEFENLLNGEERHERYAQHPRPYNVNIGQVHAGDWTSTVPNECIVEVRVGFDPIKDPQEVKDQLQEFLIKYCQQDEWLREHPLEVTFYGFHAQGCIVDSKQEIVQDLAAVHEEITGEEVHYSAFTGTTDMRFFNLYYDIPTICYGPTGGNYHGIDEWVDLESVKKLTKTYAAFLLKWCGIAQVGSEEK